MNNILSSPPSFGQQHEDNKEQLRDIIVADAQRDSNTPIPGMSDITDMPSTPPTIPSAGAANGLATSIEVAAEYDHEMEADPSDEIQKFDWEELQARYHDMIKERGNVEESLWAEFKELIDV